MVFENLVGYLLDKYLGDYIENLDTKKLKVDLWSGNVVLENLYLKPNALADLDLPVRISIGYLEKLILEVPWKSLYTSPIKATIDGLYLLVVPKTEVEYDAKRDEKEQHEAKMREVHKIEQLRKEKEEAEKNAKESEKKLMIHLLNECNYKSFEILNYQFKIFILSMKIKQQNLTIHLPWELH